MSDYHGDGMNVADQLREAVMENKRLLARCDRAEAVLWRILEILADPPTPSRMLIPLIRDAIYPEAFYD